MNLGIDLCGVALKSPIMPASGTFGFGRDFEPFYDIASLGAVCTKGLTLVERAGNEPPRITETPSGILNSVGLQNPGIDAFLTHELPWLLHKGIPIVANIAGWSVDDFVALARRLDDTDVALLEVNVSCPNVHAYGRVFGADEKSIAEVTSAVRHATTKPIMIKLSPNVSDIAACGRAAEEAGADALSLINTLTGIAIDVHTRRLVLANGTGGLSGPAIRPIALHMCHQVAHNVSIPIVGMGGIMTGEDVAAFLLAGCRAVQIGTANLSNPMACPRILAELEAYMRQQHVEDVNDLVGTLITD
ncbi:MAG: dihydroorotate dehydrogenase [Oscillospiraceae bacterium]